MKKLCLILALLLLLPACSPVIDTTSFPEEETWLTPGALFVTYYADGLKTTFPIAIHNGADESRRFYLVCRNATRLMKDYEHPPDGCNAWVAMPQNELTLAPKETRELICTLEVPKGTPLPKRWEVWLSATGQKQGMINIELASRILVTMR